MPKVLDQTSLSSQLEMVFKECDQEAQGFLTESSLSSALDQVLPLKDKLEVLNILGVLNCSDARVSLPVFKQKVLEFLERTSEKEKDSDDVGNGNNVEYETFMNAFDQTHPQVTAQRTTAFSSLDESINLKMTPFKPNLNSSFLFCESASCSPPDTPTLPRLSFSEDTFEGDGEEKRAAAEDVVETDSRKTSILHSRSLRFRKHLRSQSRSRAVKYNRALSSPSSLFTDQRIEGDEEPDRINNNSTKYKLDFTELSRLQSDESKMNGNHMDDCLGLEQSLLKLKLQTDEDERIGLQEENNALIRQLNQSHLVVKRFEDELSLEAKTVQSLEEKLSFVETNNKELIHELENSRHNIKNLEDHLLFMEEKFNIENRELNSEKYLLMQDKEHLNEEKKELEEKEKKILLRMEEFEIREDEIMSEKHILQLEIASLKRENKLIFEKNESLERSRQEDLNKLTLENKALKDKLNNLTLRKVDLQFVKELVISEKDKQPNQNQLKTKNMIKNLVKRICFVTALRSVYEIVIYLVKDYET